VLAHSLAAWAEYVPDILVVCHDINGDGVAATKNRGIAALMDADIEHLFLADDDMYPVHRKALKLYTQDPALHLMHCWGRSRLLTDDGHYTTWTHPRGVLLYVHRTVIDHIGGMRLDFGPRGGGEHVEFSRRIHNAGFTEHRYMDISAAQQGLWHCEDYTRAVRSTVGPKALHDSAEHRHAMYKKFEGSTDFVPYRKGQ
jgi:hypothetical protein